MLLPVLVLLLALGGVAPSAVDAQEEGTPLRLDVQGSGSVVVRLGDILSDPDLGEALESGLPLRLEVVTQLWSDGFFDSQVDQSRWRANVFHDALEDAYVLQMERPTVGDGTSRDVTTEAVPEADSTARSGADASESPESDQERGVYHFPTLGALRAELPRALEPPLEPVEEGRYYYLARLSVETLSLSDLEELRRWLRGDLAPAISGDGDVGGAAERGLRRTVIRLLGMPTRRFDARTPTFDHGPGED